MNQEKRHESRNKESLFYSNNLALLREILDEGTSVNIKNDMGETPIFKAGPEKTRLLLEYSPFLYLKNKKSEDVLKATIKSKLSEKDKLKKCQLLMDNGYDIEKLKGNANPLFYISETSIADYFIEKGVSIFDLNDHGRNVFFNMKAKKEMFERYKEAGLDINHKDNQSHNAFLFFASLFVHEEKLNAMIKILESGIDPYYSGENKHTAHPLLNNNNSGDFLLKIIKVLKKIDNFDFKKIVDKVGRTPLFFCKRIEEAELFIKCGVEINALSAKGNTALMEHCRNIKMAEFLIKKGADIHIDNESRPLIFDACNELIPVLKEHGYNINITNRHGENALFALSNKESAKKKILALKENGIDFLHISNNGIMALDALPPVLNDWTKEMLGEEISQREKLELEDAMKKIDAPVSQKMERI